MLARRLSCALPFCSTLRAQVVLGRRGHAVPTPGARIKRRESPQEAPVPASASSSSGSSLKPAPVLEQAPAPVQEALQLVLGSLAPIEARLGAVQALGDMMAPPYNLEAAEDALHEILCEAQGEDGQRIADAAEVALWSGWHLSGKEEIDSALQRGMAMMEKEQTEEAVLIFTEIISKCPEFAEGWNKRATANFVLKRYEDSLSDGLKTLQLKPRHFGCLAGLGMVHQAMGDNVQALKSFKAAVHVHPRIEGARRIAERLELQNVVNEHLRPQIVRVARSLDESGKVEQGSPTPAESPAVLLPSDGLVCEWDLHHVVEDGVDWKYFIRVRLRNESSARNPVRSLARFYALRFAGGRIFPLTRLTEGASAFKLEPGEESRFCWHVVFRQELQDAGGGLLLEAESCAGTETQEPQFLHADLKPKAPVEASCDEVERMKLGYEYTGQLNLRELNLGKPEQQ